jgi:hypothetical protein
VLGIEREREREREAIRDVKQVVKTQNMWGVMGLELNTDTTLG